MTLLSLQNLNLTYSGVSILENLNLQVEKKERICLSGRNGAGKTTMMKVIAGEIKPDSGFIQTAPGVKISYFSQEIPDDIPGNAFEIIASRLGDIGKLIIRYQHAEQVSAKQESAEFPENTFESNDLREDMDSLEAWKWLDEIGRVTAQMEINSEWLYNNLSGGQKRRVLLASALVCKPDILLLDEPTNHLDIDTIAWIEDFLLKTSLTILFVTHDRMLLNRLATRILELDRGHLCDWKCDYKTFLSRKQELLSVEQKDWDRFDKKLAQEETWIRKGVQARRTRNEGRVNALKKMREERKLRRQRIGKVNMQISRATDSGNDVIDVKNISFAYDEKIIIKDFSLKIKRGDRIGVVGANGCGKTTLIKLLLGQLKPLTGEISHGTKLEPVYFDQMRTSLNEQKTVWENVSADSDTVNINGRDVHIITYLQNFLFSSERAKSRVSILSGGERNRVSLAKLFSTPANLIILDEPTNDLDIETLELLEELINEFTGTVLLICHDREFLNNLVSSTLVFAPNGEIKEIIGGYDEWLNEKKAAIAEESRIKSIEAEKAKKNQELAIEIHPKKSLKLSFKEKQELTELPDKIDAAEKEIVYLQKKLSDPAFYKSGEDASTLSNRLSHIEEELLIHLQRWEELEQKTS